MLPMLTTRAGSSWVPASSSSGRNARVRKNGDFRFRSSTLSHADPGKVSSGSPQVAPALLTRMCSSSSRSPTTEARRRHSSSVERSAGTETTLPKELSSATAASPASGLRELMYTRTPAWSRPRATISPMPRVPPVTTATLPLRSNRSTAAPPRTSARLAARRRRQTIDAAPRPDGRRGRRLCQPLTMIPLEPDAPVMGATSEVGRLRTVLLHRPGPELRRLTPRNNDQLLFDGVPWVARAQEEHDAFAEALTMRGVEVLYVDRLLTEILSFPSARAELIGAAVDDPRLGATLQRAATTHLAWLSPEELSAALISGLAHDELRGGRGLAYEVM